MNATQRKILLDHGFLVGAQIGKGTFGTVFQCTDLKSHVTYALKAMDLRSLRMRSEFQESRLMREVQVMRKLHHPFIVGLHDVIFTEDYLFLIMELVVGVDLFDTIVAKCGFDEIGGRFVFYQLCSALEYIHDQGILHRDVKPENILLRGPSIMNGGLSSVLEMTGCVPSKTWIKLVDFGLSKMQTGDDLNSFVGTPRYIAPEVISVGEEEKRRRSSEEGTVEETVLMSTYSTPADCFSAGICLFVMLANCFPKFNQGIITFETGKASTLSLEAKDLIWNLTNPDPNQRYSMKQALNHVWLIPAKNQVESLIRSETRLVTIKKSNLNNKNIHINNNLNVNNGSSNANNGSRPPKRAFVQSFVTANTSLPQMVTQQWTTPPTISNPNGSSSVSSSTSFPTTSSSQQNSWFNNFNSTGTGPTTISSSSTTTASTTPYLPSYDQMMMISQQQQQPKMALTNNIDREFWNACEASPTICSVVEVRNAIRATKNLLVQTERVVMKCGQTVVSVLDLIPDIQAALETADGSTYEYVRSMLDMVKGWIQTLKSESSETLKNNHQILLGIGTIVQQISLSPDVVAESVAALSFNNNRNEDHHRRSPPQTPNLICLSHFEKAENLLRIHESFWGRMETALDVLQQRALSIEGFMTIVLKNPSVTMADRFVQKLEEYFSLWKSAALLCQQYQQQYQPNNDNVISNGINNLSIQPLQSTVVVVNETSPSSSLESYDGDI